MSRWIMGQGNNDANNMYVTILKLITYFRKNQFKIYVTFVGFAVLYFKLNTVKQLFKGLYMW